MKIRFGMLSCLFLIALFYSGFAFAQTSLPVVTIEGEYLEEFQGKEDVRDAVLTYRDFDTGVSFTRAITIRPQGSSSLGYDKKNYTISLTEEAVAVVPEWGEQSIYCLKANYIDPTQACNVVSARLAAQMNAAYGLYEETPNHGTIDGFPVWLIMNGRDAGLYTWNIPKSAWMFGMDEAEPNHIVMCSEGWTDACLFRQDFYELDADWSLEVGQNTSATIEKFTRLMRFIAEADDESFVEQFDQYLNLDACLNYYCFICISDALDNCGKNMLMATWDGQVWYPMLYDLDSLWGIHWDGCETCENSALEIVYCENRLFERIRALYWEQLCTRYVELRSDLLSETHIQEEFNQFAEKIPENSYVMDWEMWNGDGALIRSFDLMWALMDEYLPLVDAEFGYEASTD